MTEQGEIKCPKCGAYLTGQIAETTSSVACQYCNTTILIPKPERAKRKTWREKKPENMTREDLDEALDDSDREDRKRDKEHVERLELKKKNEGLTEREERELIFATNVLKDSRAIFEYCESCFRKYGCYCVKCGVGVCVHDDCPNIISAEHHFNQRFVRWDRKAKFSLYCPSCEGFVCARPACYNVRYDFLGRENFYCGKCQTKLEKRPAHYTMETH